MSNFLIVESYNKRRGYCNGSYKVIYEGWLDTGIDKKILGSFIAENYNDAGELFNSWLEGEK